MPGGSTQDANLVGAAARGTSEGLSLALNVAAMLISFLALIAPVNATPGRLSSPEVTLETILGYVLRPVALVMGVPLQDAQAVGSLLGLRMVANEFIAFRQLAGDLKTTVDPPRCSPSRPTRCAGSPTSRPSASRSAASAPWPPSARTTSAGWACAR